MSGFPTFVLATAVILIAVALGFVVGMTTTAMQAGASVARQLLKGRVYVKGSGFIVTKLPFKFESEKQFDKFCDDHDVKVKSR